MNILIVGGLLALAVVAIVGAVLLGISEERAEKQRKEASAALPTQTPSAPQVPDATLPTATLPSTPSGTLTSGDTRTTRQLAPSLHKEESAALPTQISSVPQVPDATPPTATLPSTPSGTPTSGELRTTRQLAPSLHEEGHVSAYSNGHLSVPNLSVSNEEEYIAFVNAQIHATTGELRSLVQKASELEQRLNMLSEILESRQRPQNDTASRTSAFRKIEMSSF